MEYSSRDLADLMWLQARSSAILLMGIGLLEMAVALAGRRRIPGLAAWASWAFVGTLAGAGASELASGAILGLFDVSLGIVALEGQMLVRRERKP